MKSRFLTIILVADSLLKRLVVIAMFMGTYNHTIDPKGRLSIPAKYREKLGEEFVVAKGMDGCLFVYDNDEWAAFHKQLTSLPTMTVDETRMLRRFFLSGAQTVTVDKQGRILMPQELKEFAGLEKDVVLAGVGERIEIWSLEKWQRTTEQLDINKITHTLAGLGISI